MRFSLPEQNSQSSFYLLKAQLEQETRRKKIEERNSIKINRKKLPSDFFKKSVERSFSRKSSLDPCSNRSSNQKSIPFIKSPQTQRKISSQQYLPSSQVKHVNEFDLGKTDMIRFQFDNTGRIYKRLLQKQSGKTNEKAQTNRTLRSVDPAKSYSLNQKQIREKKLNKVEFQGFIYQKNSSNFIHYQSQDLSSQNNQSIDMGCTFGKGFANHVNCSLQNSILLKKPTGTKSAHLDELETKNPSYLRVIKDSRQYEVKSTQESEVTDALKSFENTPRNLRNIKKLFGICDQAGYFEHPKTIKTRRNFLNRDLSQFQDLPLQNQKAIFTAEQKQRKIKNRLNNSSNDYRQKSLRKDKMIEGLNLPKIGRTIKFRD